jgi:hypothetical protein
MLRIANEIKGFCGRAERRGAELWPIGDIVGSQPAAQPNDFVPM